MHAFDFDNALTIRRAWKMKFHLALGSVQGQDYDTRPIGDISHGGVPFLNDPAIVTYPARSAEIEDLLL